MRNERVIVMREFHLVGGWVANFKACAVNELS